jgi:hypothetical protein
MAANKLQRFGPTAMVTGATGSNYINPAASGAGAVGYTATATYAIIRHIRIVNKTATGSTFSLYVGGTTGSAAGTEVIGTGLLVAANTAFDWYGALRLDAADFLSGTANNLTSLVFEAEGEIGLS